MVALKKFSTVNIQVHVSIKPCLILEIFVTFILQIFDFQIISKFLNSRANTCAVYKAYSIS